MEELLSEHGGVIVDAVMSIMLVNILMAVVVIISNINCYIIDQII